MSLIALPAVIRREGKSLIPKPGQTGLLSYDRQPVWCKLHKQWYGWMMAWMTYHLVEVTQTMIPTDRRYRANRGEWPLRHEFTNCGT